MSVGGESGINEHSLISSNTEIAFSRLDDDLLAMDERAGFCYSLNVSAARIWDLIRTPTSVEAVCSALCKEFQVDAATCMRDVSELLNELLAAGLIKVSSDAARV
jgi:hypothetical protein